MNKKRVAFIAFGAIIAVCFICFVCFVIPKSGLNKEYSETAFYMDTTVTVKIIGENCEETAKAMFNTVDVLEKFCLSRTVEGSDIFNINLNGNAEVSDQTLEAITLSLDVCKRSNGALDIGIGSLVDLWSVTSGRSTPPSADEVAALSGNKYDLISVDGSIVTIDKSGLLDLGAVGKGYACDRIHEVAEMAGLKKAVVSVGGSILFYGDDDFTVGIASPERGSTDYIATISIPACCVSTSGTYERFFDYDGVCYHHILNPVTGYPVQNGLTSVTVISENGLISDALSTACFVLGIEKGKELCKEYGCQAVFVTDDKLVYTTDSIRDSVNLIDSEYRFA